MFGEIRRLAESSLAIRAFERFLAVVHSFMDRKGTRDRERLSTTFKVAYEWLYR